MAILNLPLDQIQLFIFVLVRVGAILFSIPFLDARNVPLLVKASLAVAVSVLLTPQLKFSAPSLTAEPVVLAIGLMAEVAIGLSIGLVFQLLITGVQLAGQTAGFQMGIAIANVMDPTSSLQIPVLSQFLNLFALMLFLALNMHNYFLHAMADAFELIPPLGVHFNQGLLELMMMLVANSFVVAVKIGAPVMAALLLTSVALALMARTVPQMQIFIVAMPIKILLGLFFLAASLSFCGNYLQKVFTDLGHSLFALIRLFQ